MIGKILGGGQLGKLASFVSPAFFDVMPAKSLWNRSRKLLAGTRDREAFRHAVAARATELQRAIPAIELLPEGKPASKPSTGSASPETRGAQVAELFFHQLFHGDTVLLDLRGTSFTPTGDKLLWHPASWLANWTPEFISALRDIYRGFYAHDDQQFRAGLAALSLTHSEDLFRKHFGGGQERVTFRTVDFIDTFHQVFQRCKQAHVALHPDFLPLGIYLAALYDHLEDLAVAVDVKAAFERATGTSTESTEAVHA
ncbi:MAG TPA: hypothetical protein VFG30_13165 [Polyangiales bacterium]|jgi:hypothetical protein|nr:hypothetical protein [Polyangiales bacterium]